MSEPIKCHITKSEQIALSRALTKAECRGRAERERKSEAFEALHLSWVDAAGEAITRISATEIRETYDKLLEAGATPDVAMARVVSTVVSVVQADPYVGQRTGQDDVSLSPGLLSWVLDKLDKAEPCGADDLLVAAVEARLRLAERGGYVAATPPVNHASASATA